VAEILPRRRTSSALICPAGLAAGVDAEVIRDSVAARDYVALQLPAPVPQLLPDGLNLCGGDPVTGIFLIRETVHASKCLGEYLPVKSTIGLGRESHELLPVVAPTGQDPGQVEIVAGFSPANTAAVLEPTASLSASTGPMDSRIGG
jgi:hypothetical protein